jgi:hypothetical protein
LFAPGAGQGLQFGQRLVGIQDYGHVFLLKVCVIKPAWPLGWPQPFISLMLICRLRPQTAWAASFRRANRNKIIFHESKGAAPGAPDSGRAADAFGAHGTAQNIAKYFIRA